MKRNKIPSNDDSTNPTDTAQRDRGHSANFHSKSQEPTATRTPRSKSELRLTSTNSRNTARPTLEAPRGGPNQDNSPSVPRHSRSVRGPRKNQSSGAVRAPRRPVINPPGVRALTARRPEDELPRLFVIVRVARPMTEASKAALILRPR